MRSCKDGVTLNQGPFFTPIFTIAEIDGPIKQGWEVGLARLTVTLNDLFGKFVLLCPYTLSLLCSGPQRESVPIK